MSIGDYSWLVVAWCGVALFLGGTIKGSLGVGTPLLTVPLMAMVLPVHLAVVLMAIPVVLANGWQAFFAGNPVPVLRRFWPMFLAILAGTFMGTQVLVSLDAKPLLIIVGSFVIAFAVLQHVQPDLRWPASLERPIGVGFGLLGGLVGGVSSMFGPALIVYLVSLQLDKERFVKAISFLYLSAVVPWAVTLGILGVLAGDTLRLSAAAAVSTFCGVLFGQYVRTKISETRFRGLVLVIVVMSGLGLLVRGLTH